MGYLLLLHEKMRLTRRKNQLTARKLTIGNKKERMTKRIANVQKLYSKKIAMIDSQQKQASTGFQVYLNQMSGLGTQGLNPFNYGGLGGVSMFVMQGLAAWAANGMKPGADGKGGYSSADASRVYNLYQQGGGFTQNLGEDGKPISGQEYKNGAGTISSLDYQAFCAATSQIQNQQLQMQWMTQQMSQQYNTNLSIWAEAAKEELEMEQEAALAPLQEIDSDLEQEETSIGVQLEDVKTRLDAITQELKDEIQKSAPFGL